MKISFKGDYALKIILDLAMAGCGSVTTIKEISRRQDIPERFLEQIITVLKGAGYVRTVRGKRGGVSLAVEPSRITVGEIIRLIDGYTSPIACVSKTGRVHCNFEARCVFKDMFEEIRNRTNEVIDTATFDKLVEKAHQLNNKNILDFSI